MEHVEKPKIGQSTMWGIIESVHTLLDGIWSIGTSRHGGIKLSQERTEQMPDYMRCPGGMYEEDCKWAIVFCVFESELQGCENENVQSMLSDNQHRRFLKQWNPYKYKRFFNIHTN